MALSIASPAFGEGDTIPVRHTGTGANLSPELHWSEPPAGTKSFAVLAHDPDAPTGGAGFWHWLVVDIPADVRSLKQGAGDASGKHLPAGAHQLENDFGDKSYGGPCPPPGAPPPISEARMAPG